MTTCTALATLIAINLGTRTNVHLANFAQTITSGHPIRLVFGLSQHAVNLLYRYRDPRCTVVVVVVGASGKAYTRKLKVTITVER